jgi:hypothetical protein
MPPQLSQIRSGDHDREGAAALTPDRRRVTARPLLPTPPPETEVFMDELVKKRGAAFWGPLAVCAALLALLAGWLFHIPW